MYRCTGLINYLVYDSGKLKVFFYRPTIEELPDAVINKMVQKDIAFWVDKPGDNAYTLHDAYYDYGMTTEIVLPRTFQIITH